MGINDLQLTSELIASLYPEILISGQDPGPDISMAKSPDDKPATTPVYAFLGKNLRSLSILVSCPGVEFIPGEQLIFLEKILAACKYSLDDIALINTYQQPVNIENLKNQLHPDIVFLWGKQTPIPGLPESLEDMSISTWGSIRVLSVTQVELMSGDSAEGLALKRILWSSLKKIFNL